MRIWVDDERPMPESWNDESGTLSVFSQQCTTSADAIEWLECFRRNNALRGYPLNYMIDEVSLDHDLGGDDTGFNVLDWMIDNNIWPKVLTIHTANPVARKRMLAAANAEAPEDVEIFVIYDHLTQN